MDRPFDLTGEPLIRLYLLQVSSEEHVLGLFAHHIIYDGWSMDLVRDELLHFYAAFHADAQPARPEPPIQYADYSTWQKGWLTGEVRAKQLAYWTEYLRGVPVVLELPADRPRRAGTEPGGAVCHFELPAEVTERVHAVCASTGATPFMVLLAGFAVLLNRYTRQDEFCIGYPIANRNHPGVDRVVGFFVNTLVYRANLEGNPTFAELLARTRTATVRSYANQDLPFDQVVNALQIVRERDSLPLVQCMFAWQESPRFNMAAGGVSWQSLPSPVRRAKFELALAMWEHQGRLEGSFEFDAALRDRHSVDGMIRHLGTLLGALCADPGRRVMDPPMLSAAQLRAFGDAARDIYLAQPNTWPSVHSRFEERVRLSPSATAVVCDGIAISYAQLNARANTLARRILRDGVSTDQLVPVFLERSIDLIVAILGILKAGGAYVPIDSEHPPERISFILQDVAAPTLVTSQSLMSRLPASAANIVYVDCIQSDPASAVDPDQDVSQSNLAYCIYTSGSTGQPKGVLVTHGNLTRLFTSTAHWFDFSERDVWTLFHSPAFDFSVWEIFGALLHGGRLVIVPQLVSRSPEQFHALLRGSQVTVLNQTPAAFQQLLSCCEADPHGFRLEHLRLVIFGGDALNVAALAPWFAHSRSGATRLVNMYGITETTVHVTYRQIEAGTAAGLVGSPIGRPIPDLRVHVLDRAMNPVPQGVQGEIYVGGAGVARGYLNRPQLTNERFLPDPFCGNPHERLYRSGDLARVRADGELEYLGRADAQIKLRGFRIEPGEIESGLLGLEGVTAATVQAIADRGGERRLVAWMVTAPGSGLDSESVRSQLARRLPSYMVPADFVMLPQMPLTPNGKLDRARLPIPARGHNIGTGDYMPPCTAHEQALALIWEEILEVPRVGTRENFFSAGGDSIRAAQVVRAARLAGLPITLADLFTHQTIGALAQTLDSRSADPPAPVRRTDLTRATVQVTKLTAHEAADFEELYPLSGMQRIMVEHYQYNEQHGLGIYHVQQTFQLYDPQPSPAAMQAALALLVDAHPVLRTRLLQEPGSAIVQGIATRGTVAVSEHDLRRLEIRDQSRFLDDFLLRDRATPFAVGAAEGLTRFSWLQLADTRFEFAMSIHHAIDDGWGNQVFLQELFDLYVRLKEGQSIRLPRQPNVLREAVALERQDLETGFGDAYWASLALNPVTRAQPAYREEQNRHGYSVEVPTALVEQLRVFARRQGVALKTVLLGAYLDVLAAQTGRDNVVAGVVSNGRGHRLSDPFRSLGLFWNLVPVPRPAPLRPWAAGIAALQRQLAQMEPFATVPLAHICTLHGADELFDATFNFINFHNSFAIDGGSGLRLLSGRTHDKFHYPLNLLASFDRSGGTLHLHVEYDNSRFPAVTVAQLVRRFLRLLELEIASGHSPEQAC
jgi:amino acid adenylation domain-containing protein